MRDAAFGKGRTARDVQPGRSSTRDLVALSVVEARSLRTCPGFYVCLALPFRLLSGSLIARSRVALSTVLGPALAGRDRVTTSGQARGPVRRLPWSRSGNG